MRGHRHGGGWLLRMCEPGTINRELRQGRELPLLSLHLVSLQLLSLQLV